MSQPNDPQKASLSSKDQARELAAEDFYFEGPYLVFTTAFHLKRGYCCNSGCRHCPWRETQNGAQASAKP